jgi:hypothetical protein
MRSERTGCASRAAVVEQEPDEERKYGGDHHDDAHDLEHLVAPILLPSLTGRQLHASDYGHPPLTSRRNQLDQRVQPGSPTSTFETVLPRWAAGSSSAVT